MDEGFGLGAACDGADPDLCPEGVLECDGSGGTRCGELTADSPETCNGVDDDCDGQTDESCSACGAGGWVIEPAAAPDDVGAYIAAARDGAGGIHAAWQDNTANDLVYGHHAPGGYWIPAVVDSIGTTGQHTSVDVDSGGGTHVAYYDATGTALKYVKRTPGALWTTMAAVDADDVRGQYTSIAVDPSLGVHVAYYEDSQYDTDGDTVIDTIIQGLRYAYRSPAGAWSTQALDWQGNVGLWPSVILDTAGLPHILYRDATNLDAKHAYRLP